MNPIAIVLLLALLSGVIGVVGYGFGPGYVGSLLGVLMVVSVLVLLSE